MALTEADLERAREIAASAPPLSADRERAAARDPRGLGPGLPRAEARAGRRARRRRRRLTEPVIRTPEAATEGGRPQCARHDLPDSHLDPPYKHARHYLGFAEGDHLDARLADHGTERGARLLAVRTGRVDMAPGPHLAWDHPRLPNARSRTPGSPALLPRMPAATQRRTAATPGGPIRTATTTKGHRDGQPRPARYGRRPARPAEERPGARLQPSGKRPVASP